LIKQRQEPGGVDGVTIAAVALSAMFGFFSFGMTLTSGGYLLQNKTTVDMLRKDHVVQLAVRVPRGTRSTSEYQTITYPLAHLSHWPAPDSQVSGYAPTSSDSTTASRDQQATRTFAILRSEPGENPWDLGYFGNFKAVMGHTIWEWMLPIKHSPCCNHDSMDSDYKLGPVVEEMAKRVNLPRKRSKPEHAVEMTETSGATR
jgi:palmitoyltransferase